MGVNDCGPLYHLVQVELWEGCKREGRAYVPPTYEADGFIHLTKEPALLLGVANHFYRDVKGPYLVLEIDSSRLAHVVKFEAAAPVGDKEAHSAGAAVQFPHLYGPLEPLAAVVRELAVARGDDGSFLSIEGLSGA